VAALKRPRVIAHRGESMHAPEQTLAAYGRAVELGAEMIEADVRRTRDGHLVLLHDATVDRTTDGRGPVAELSFVEVRRLDAGGWFAAAFAGEQVPALDELFELAGDARISLCLEVKGESLEVRRELAHEVARAIAERGRLELDVLASFDHAALADAARAVPGLRCAPDRLPERGPSTGSELVAQAHAIGAPIVQHHHEDLTAAAVAETQRAGVEVWAWPTNTRAEIERVLALDVAGVMGDDVATLVECVSAPA
jgi:glycerophosphoryl diester phosphodiesterase